MRVWRASSTVRKGVCVRGGGRDAAGEGGALGPRAAEGGAVGGGEGVQSEGKGCVGDRRQRS